MTGIFIKVHWHSGSRLLHSRDALLRNIKTLNWILSGIVSQLYQVYEKRRSNDCWELADASLAVLIFNGRGWGYSFVYIQFAGPLKARHASHFTPGRPVNSETIWTFLGSIQPCCNYCMKIHNSHFESSLSPVLIYTAQWTGPCERKCPIFETVAKGIRTRALSADSPMFYHSEVTKLYFSINYLY